MTEYTDATLPTLAFWDMSVRPATKFAKRWAGLAAGVYREIRFAEIPELQRRVTLAVGRRQGFDREPDFVVAMSHAGVGAAVCGWKAAA